MKTGAVFEYPKPRTFSLVSLQSVDALGPSLISRVFIRLADELVERFRRVLDRALGSDSTDFATIIVL